MANRIMLSQEDIVQYIPAMEIAPFCVAVTTASIIPLVPAAKLSNSNTPGGLWRKLVVSFHIKTDSTTGLNYSKSYLMIRTEI